MSSCTDRTSGSDMRTFRGTRCPATSRSINGVVWWRGARTGQQWHGIATRDEKQATQYRMMVIMAVLLTGHGMRRT